MEKPNENNACSLKYDDWLEVNLTNVCNAKCSWCVEKQGWHPSYSAPWEQIVQTAISTGKTNIILLGGEPTLHKDFRQISESLTMQGRKVWVTTNGSNMNPMWISQNMHGVHGVNISIHHYDMAKNEEITGLLLDEDVLFKAIRMLHRLGATVRLNCNCIKGYIDSTDELRHFVAFAKRVGADCVRFAELKNADESFVDLAVITNYQFGTNQDPYRCGCSHYGEIDGLSVNFRQMCGMQTKLRPCPKEVAIHPHPVLYYDGNLYNGWQLKDKVMGKDQIETILEMVKDGTLSVKDARKLLEQAKPTRVITEQVVVERKPSESGGYCRY